jgi:6,7-dimethyl-8-ribityllumazine synthase
MKKRAGTKKQKKNKIAIVVSKFNSEITEGLLKGALLELNKNSYSEKDIYIVSCPGAFEITITAKKLCMSKKYAAVICLGAVIKGQTAHFEFIAYAVTHGIMQLNFEYDTPVIFGVLTCYTEEQALKRSSNDEENKGAEAARAALEMIGLLKSIK